MFATLTSNADLVRNARASRTFSLHAIVSQLVKHSREMRLYRKQYFASNSPDMLKRALAAERAVDFLLNEFETKMYGYDLATCDVVLRSPEDVGGLLDAVGV